MHKQDKEAMEKLNKLMIEIKNKNDLKPFMLKSRPFNPKNILNEDYSRDK